MAAQRLVYVLVEGALVAASTARRGGLLARVDALGEGQRRRVDGAGGGIRGAAWVGRVGPGRVGETAALGEVSEPVIASVARPQTDIPLSSLVR